MCKLACEDLEVLEFESECGRCRKIEKFSYDRTPKPKTMAWTLARNAMRARGWYCARGLVLCRDCIGVIARYHSRQNT